MTKMPLLAFALLLMPGAAAHGAPTVLDVETQFIADETTDLTYLYDGYDLASIWIREAHYGEDGIVVRILADGGQMLGAAGELSFELEIETENGTVLHTFATSDDEAWTGSADIVEVFVTPDEALPAVNVNLQVFIPRSELGDSFGAVTVRSLAGGQVVDAAPGPLFAPLVAAPIPAEPLISGSERLVAGLDLAGPIGYTNTTVESRGAITFVVDNLITTTGQHVFIKPQASQGWELKAINGSAQALEAGQDARIAFAIMSTGAGALPVFIETDLGGREMLLLVATPDGVAVADSAPAVTAQPSEQTTPAAPVALLLVGLVLLARRR